MNAIRSQDRTRQASPISRSGRRGVSLLEVTIGSFMAAVIAVMASSVAVDLSRHMAANIAQTSVTAEARLAIESFRRDFAGTLPEDRSGQRSQWRLVGRMIPSPDELRLCYDADLDASADWIAPDRVIVYRHIDDRLIRDDVTSGTSFTVARYVQGVEFKTGGGEIEVTIDFDHVGYAPSYTFVTPDLK